jgi:antitoxin HicB
MSKATIDPQAPVDPKVEARVAEIMRRPYRKVITGDNEQVFLAEVPDLPGCMTAGESEEDALMLLRDAMAGWLTVSLERGLPIPEPKAETCNGRILVRTSKSLHRQLVARAEAEGVSLNQWIVTLLAEGMGRRGPADR